MYMSTLLYTHVHVHKHTPHTQSYTNIQKCTARQVPVAARNIEDYQAKMYVYTRHTCTCRLRNQGGTRRMCVCVCVCVCVCPLPQRCNGSSSAGPHCVRGISSVTTIFLHQCMKLHIVMYFSTTFSFDVFADSGVLVVWVQCVGAC